MAKLSPMNVSITRIERASKRTRIRGVIILFAFFMATIALIITIENVLRLHEHQQKRQHDEWQYNAQDDSVMDVMPDTNINCEWIAIEAPRQDSVHRQFSGEIRKK